MALVVSLTAGACLRAPGDDSPDHQGRAVAALDRGEVSRDAPALRGPGLSRPGVRLVVTPDESADLEVVEKVVSPQPIGTLRLVASPTLTPPLGATGRLLDIRARADGHRVPVRLDPVMGEARIQLAEPASRFVLRYRVTDADRRSETTPPGRTTLWLRPAVSDALPLIPAVVRVRGAAVHNLVCVDEPTERQLCGVERAGGWRTEELPAARASVVALVDLPRP